MPAAENDAEVFGGPGEEHLERKVRREYGEVDLGSYVHAASVCSSMVDGAVGHVVGVHRVIVVVHGCGAQLRGVLG